MTTAMRVAEFTHLQHKVLLVQDGNVTLAHNHSDTGNAIQIISSLLLCDNVTQAYIAGSRLDRCLGELNRLMQHRVPGWRMRISSRQRHALERGTGRKVVTGRFFVDYFCIDQKVTNSERLPRRKFDVLNLDLIADHPPDDAESQLEMALAILEMCDNRGVKYRHTRGGLGSAMLKHSPYWQRGRKAAPHFINDKARPYLPGNFYSLSHKIQSKRALSVIPHAYYIDQNSAHHNIVRSCPMPHPQHLHARGRWKTLTGKWTDPDSPTGRALMDGGHVGLVCCRMTISHIPPQVSHLYPQWALRKRGRNTVWLWTPEFRLLQNDHRLQLEYFIAAYTATGYDLAMAEYANFALGELQQNQERASYKKGSLLAAYGMLAFNPRGRHIYRYWGGQSNKPICEIPTAGLVAETRIGIPDNVQLSTVNVIARGIIESETRTRSIEYARELHYQGFHIPQIYSDGILVETHQLPFVREGWRVSHSLTSVYCPRPNAIVSDQIVKLPGVAASEQDREWERLREDSFRPVLHDARDRRLEPAY